MKLPSPAKKFGLPEQLAEFDIWITPSLGEVRDSKRFQHELLNIVEVFEALAARTDSSFDQVVALLTKEGYRRKEIQRAIQSAATTGAIAKNADRFELLESRRDTVRRYLLLDSVAVNGKTLGPVVAPVTGHLLVPGFGPLFGTKLTDALRAAIAAAPSLAGDLGNSEVLLRDLEWLEERRFVVSS